MPKFPLLSMSAALLVSTHLYSGDVQAHSGGLNAQGCHGGSKPYHCHRSPGEMVGNRLRCDLGSRSRECVGTGRATGPKVRAVQERLMEHCPSLPDDFADGVDGPNTRAALEMFQEAYGLEPDGILGPDTATALVGSITGACE